MPGDQLIQEIQVLPFLEGLQEGLDPALPNELYRPTSSPDMENVRISGGKTSTRPGMSLWKTLPGSGKVRLLDHVYTSTGQRIRLAARGDASAAVLMDYVEGTDTEFQATSGGTGLGGSDPFFKGETLNDSYYFLDRKAAASLRKYQESPVSGSQVRAVALPVAPAAAPVVTARTYEVLDPWTGAAPYSWTEADAAKFALQAGTGTIESPLGGVSALLNTLTNPKNSAITRNVTDQSVPSSTIAWWEYATNIPTNIVFQFGIRGATEFTETLAPPTKNEWHPHFVRIGNLGTISYKRFLVVQNSGAADTYLSKLVLPGLLQGSYRYFVTHYDPTLKRESAPSPIGNNGTPLDLSVIGVSGQPSTAAAFQKSAAVSFVSDSGTDSTTTKVRIYRSGGVPALTKDNRGIDVWCRVGEVYDYSSTLSAGPAAGDTSITVASATNLAVGDWLVIERGTVSKEEYVRITVIVGTTLTISQPLVYAHSSAVAVQAVFIDNVPNEKVDLSTRMAIERDNPPTGAQWIARSPQGRLWLANYDGHPTGVRVSNRATPDRPIDYEVFPDNVDPVTRHDPNQGWGFEVGGDVTDEQITWLGLYNDRMFVFTARRLYSINAHSQTDWGPDAVTPALQVGCVDGDTVCEVDGWFYWITAGPRLMRWDGRGAPQNLSHQKANVRLSDAPPELWTRWFAVRHTQEVGRYYSLFYAPDADLGAPTLTATVISSTEIDLSWVDAAADEDGFAIERSTDNATFAVIGTVTADVTTYADTTVVAAQTYFYRIRAYAGGYP